MSAATAAREEHGYNHMRVLWSMTRGHFHANLKEGRAPQMPIEWERGVSSVTVTRVALSTPWGKSNVIAACEYSVNRETWIAIERRAPWTT